MARRNVTLTRSAVKSYEAMTSSCLGRERQVGGRLGAEARSPRRSGSSRHCRLTPHCGSEATKQSTLPLPPMDCFASLRNDRAFFVSCERCDETFQSFGLGGSATRTDPFLLVAPAPHATSSYQRLGRAEDPFFTVRWSARDLARLATARSNPGPDPIEKKRRNCLTSEKVSDTQNRVSAMQLTFKDSTPPKGRAVSVLSAAQRRSPTAGPAQQALSVPSSTTIL